MESTGAMKGAPKPPTGAPPPTLSEDDSDSDSDDVALFADDGAPTASEGTPLAEPEPERALGNDEPDQASTISSETESLPESKTQPLAVLAESEPVRAHRRPSRADGLVDSDTTSSSEDEPPDALVKPRRRNYESSATLDAQCARQNRLQNMGTRTSRESPAEPAEPADSTDSDWSSDNDSLATSRRTAPSAARVSKEMSESASDDELSQLSMQQLQAEVKKLRSELSLGRARRKRDKQQWRALHRHRDLATSQAYVDGLNMPLHRDVPLHRQRQRALRQKLHRERATIDERQAELDNREDKIEQQRQLAKKELDDIDSEIQQRRQLAKTQCEELMREATEKVQAATKRQQEIEKEMDDFVESEKRKTAHAKAAFADEATKRVAIVDAQKDRLQEEKNGLQGELVSLRKQLLTLQSRLDAESRSRRLSTGARRAQNNSHLQHLQRLNAAVKLQKIYRRKVNRRVMKQTNHAGAKQLASLRTKEREVNAAVKIQRHIRARQARHLMKAAHKAAGMYVQKLRETQANERLAKEEIESLREQVDEAEEFREITPRLERQLKRMERDHTADLNKMELDHRLAIEKKDRQHQADLRTLEQKYAEKLIRAEVDAEDRVSGNERLHYDDQLSAAVESALEKARRQHQTELRKLKAKHKESLEQAEDDAAAHYKAKEKDHAAMITKIREYEEEIRGLQEEARGNERLHYDDQLSAAVESALEKARRQHQTELRKLKAKHKESLEQAEDDAAAHYKAKEKDHAAMITKIREYEEEIRGLQEEARGNERLHYDDQLSAAVESALEKARRQHQTELRKLKAKHKESLEQAEDDAAAHYKAKEKDHAAMITKIREYEEEIRGLQEELQHAQEKIKQLEAHEPVETKKKSRRSPSPPPRRPDAPPPASPPPAAHSQRNRTSTSSVVALPPSAQISTQVDVLNILKESKHVRFELHFKNGDREWRCQKRWSEMSSFNKQLKRTQVPIRWPGNFPDKKTTVKTWSGDWDDKRLKNRKQELQTYWEEFADWADRLASEHGLNIFDDLDTVSVLSDFLADADEDPDPVSFKLRGELRELDDSETEELKENVRNLLPQDGSVSRVELAGDIIVSVYFMAARADTAKRFLEMKVNKGKFKVPLRGQDVTAEPLENGEQADEEPLFSSPKKSLQQSTDDGLSHMKSVAVKCSVGSTVEILSKSQNRWVAGEVQNVDTQKSIITVVYMNAEGRPMQKMVPFDSPDLRTVSTGEGGSDAAVLTISPDQAVAAGRRKDGGDQGSRKQINATILEGYWKANGRKSDDEGEDEKVSEYLKLEVDKTGQITGLVDVDGNGEYNEDDCQIANAVFDPATGEFSFEQIWAPDPDDNSDEGSTTYWSAVYDRDKDRLLEGSWRNEDGDVTGTFNLKRDANAGETDENVRDIKQAVAAGKRKDGGDQGSRKQINATILEGYWKANGRKSDDEGEDEKVSEYLKLEVDKTGQITGLVDVDGNGEYNEDDCQIANAVFDPATGEFSFEQIWAPDPDDNSDEGSTTYWSAVYDRDKDRLLEGSWRNEDGDVTGTFNLKRDANAGETDENVRDIKQAVAAGKRKDGGDQGSRKQINATILEGYWKANGRKSDDEGEDEKVSEYLKLEVDKTGQITGLVDVDGNGEYNEDDCQIANAVFDPATGEFSFEQIWAPDPDDNSDEGSTTYWSAVYDRDKDRLLEGSWRNEDGDVTGTFNLKREKKEKKPRDKKKKKKTRE